MHFFTNIAKFILVTCASVKMCESVPPSPSNRMWEDMVGIKQSLLAISGELDRCNSVYTKQIDPRMSSTAILLTNIDSNLKNIQERAHVWDTFQLHVAAWNEQLATVDRKLDIISKGQEKIIQQENKCTTSTNIDDKLDQILTKLEVNENAINVINNKLDNKNYESHDSLLSEFTTRGMLSTLKIMERKLDKLQILGHTLMGRQNNMIKRNFTKNIEMENKNKLIVKCNTPPKVEEILNDVSAKVDVIFDKFEKFSYDNDKVDIGEDGFIDNQQESSGDSMLQFKSMSSSSPPCTRTNRLIETLQHSIQVVQNNTFDILDNQNKNPKLCPPSDDFEKKQNILINTVDKRVVETEKNIQEQLEKQQHRLEELLSGNCPRKTEDIGKNTEASDTVPKNDNEHKFTTNKTSCESLIAEDKNGIYILRTNHLVHTNENLFNERYCENGWTVIQRRGVNFYSPLNFNVSWNEYKNGFGTLEGDFWFGLDFIHALTKERNFVLRVELESFERTFAWAEYKKFYIDNSIENYRIIVGDYVGNASDSLSSHNGSSFSTYDKTNDDAPECCPCSVSYGGGWWFNSCFESNLNGLYYQQSNTDEYFRGIIWEHWLGNYSLKRTKMMVKPYEHYKPTNSTNTKPNATVSTVFIPEDP